MSDSDPKLPAYEELPDTNAADIHDVYALQRKMLTAMKPLVDDYRDRKRTRRIALWVASTFGTLILSSVTLVGWRAVERSADLTAAEHRVEALEEIAEANREGIREAELDTRRRLEASDRTVTDARLVLTQTKVAVDGLREEMQALRAEMHRRR